MSLQRKLGLGIVGTVFIATFAWFAFLAIDPSYVVTFEPVPKSVKLNGRPVLLDHGSLILFEEWGNYTFEADYGDCQTLTVLHAKLSDNNSSSLTITPNGVEQHGFSLDVEFDNR